jgi:hypothetical protein
MRDPRGRADFSGSDQLVAEGIRSLARAVACRLLPVPAIDKGTKRFLLGRPTSIAWR